ncbi:uncharacterized protein LOC125245914 [Megalobrama amblycephala]|uniref:uncharacterized protein LOC125245914 n=1 Tax=Megalobrama amblycephala TaxID=75352 RepID=UPI0020142BE3|nr:uncharacterized protein LOC125245914 [Megalobrama amblycephala]
MCIKLCEVHKSPSKKAGVRIPRWTKILADYHHIRELVLSSRPLMDDTSIQLFELNQRTLIQWFQRRQNTQEMSVLTQGLAAEDRIPVATTQLPPAQERLEEAPTTSGPQHEFVLPTNREGQAPHLRPGRRPGSVTAVRPITPAPAAPPTLPALEPLSGFLIVNPLVMGSGAGTSAVVSPAGPVVAAPIAPVSVSRFTQRNRRRRAKEEATGTNKRKYVRGTCI